MTRLKIGEKAPDFESVDQNNKVIRLKEYLGKKLVLFFYPKASTAGCTIEACNLRDNYQQFLKEGYEVIGISADSQKRQFNFVTKNKLPLVYLSMKRKQ